LLRQPLLTRAHEPTVRAEPVARSEDRGDRLRPQVRVAALTTAALREVRQVGDDQVELSRDRLQQVALDDAHSVGHTVEPRVRTGQLDGPQAHVDRPDLGARRSQRKRHGDRARTATDVRDMGGHRPQARQAPLYELLGRRARAPPGRGPSRGRARRSGPASRRSPYPSWCRDETASYAGRSSLTRARRLSCSSRQAGQPSR
jgi:hypothetical protein